jgi:thermitase
MRRCYSLLALFFAVGMLALSVPVAQDALAKGNDARLCSTPPLPASIVSDVSRVYATEPPEVSSTPEEEVTAATDTEPAESLIASEPSVKQPPVLNEPEVSLLRGLTPGSQKIVVAVLDTGVDQNHEELEGQVIAETNFSKSFMLSDINGHGTHVAGIIAAKDNGLGITGVAPGCSLLNVKVADDTGMCQALALAKGIIWAADNGANVINISIEIGKPSAELERAVNYAWNQGSLVIAAAGNSGRDLPVYPAYYENCLAIAAAGPDNNLAALSNFGDWVDAVAPGLDIYSSLPDDNYGFKSGTSFACAYVSGIGALLFDVVSDTNHNDRLNDEVRAIIESGCQEIDLAGIAGSL